MKYGAVHNKLIGKTIRGHHKEETIRGHHKEETFVVARREETRNKIIKGISIKLTGKERKKERERVKNTNAISLVLALHQLSIFTVQAPIFKR